jgi:hypothetical protein
LAILQVPTDRQLAVGGATVAILAVPAYIGWAGHSLGMFMSYALVAGAGLTLADRLALSDYEGESRATLFQHAILRTLSVAVVGGLIYAVARIAF